MDENQPYRYTYQPVKSRLIRILFLALACLFLMLGTLGIIVPGLPTIDFYVLACLCASKSSRRLHAWLHRNRFISKILQHYQLNKQDGLPLLSKVTISLSLLVASYFTYQSQMHPHIKYCIWIILAGVFLWIWFKLKLKKTTPNNMVLNKDKTLD